ncbi:hypothetical protein AX14_000458 [Amanita brunnescens Koide BX004]|nr:hypothetical protein AX14_000458 [Amanita brunnescens Koide BX004]
MSQTAPGTFSGDYRGNFAGGLSSPVTPFFGRYGGVPTFNITNAIFTYNDISQLTGTFDTDAGAVIGPNNAEVSFTQSGTDYTFTISGVLQSVLNESYAISGWIEWIDTT